MTKEKEIGFMILSLQALRNIISLRGLAKLLKDALGSEEVEILIKELKNDKI